MSLHATWAEYEDLPFAPGASPFRLKGIAYRGHIEYANQFVPGGANAVNAAFRNPALRPFFEQPFLAASWYDALPILSAWQVCARVLNQPAIEFLKVRTRHQAQQDINGVYRLILKLASAETVALRIPRVVGKYFDFGTSDAEVIRPGLVRLSQTGIPMLMAPWFTIVADTYLQVALEIAGATGVHVRRRPMEPSGHAHGLAVGAIAAEVAFDTTPKRTET
jgi:hypothetical protein